MNPFTIQGDDVIQQIQDNEDDASPPELQDTVGRNDSFRVEFFSKYGVICEYAAVVNKPLLILISGTFAEPSYWNWLDPEPTRSSDEDSPLSVMLTTTGLAVGVFDTLEHMNNWISAAQDRLRDLSSDERYQHVNLILATVAPDGSILEEGLLAPFPTQRNQ